MWASIGGFSKNLSVAKCTFSNFLDKTPKFQIINLLLSKAQIAQFDYVMVVDDDVELPEAFIDNYIECVEQYKLSLAQPARTSDSYIDHDIVSQMDGVIARETNFVEIGPIFSIRSDAFDLLLPFDETSPMGWGYDFVWPKLISAADLKMGIVDCLPVSHALRKPVSEYSVDIAKNQMTDYLDKQGCAKSEEGFANRKIHFGLLKRVE